SGPVPACTRLWMRTSTAREGDSTLTISNSLSRSRGAFFASGFLPRCFTHPDEGVAERRESSGACEAPVGPARNAAGQAPSEAPCVPRRTLASRRSTVAVFGSGPALPSPELLPDRSQRAPRVRVVVPGGRGPVPPGAAVANRCRGTPLLAPYSGMPREHAPNEQGWERCSRGAARSQYA